MSSLLLIDDDEAYRRVMVRRLASLSSFNILDFASAEEALALDINSADVIVLDMVLGAASGLDYIPALNAKYQPTHFIMLTGYASVASTVEAMRRGATDYIAKPVSVQELLQRIQGASQQHASPTLMSPAQVEWEHIQRALLANQGNISATAQQLGMHRRTLQRKLKKHAPR